MKYLLKKVFTLIITLFIVSLLAFLAFQVISDPATAMLGTSATPESLAALREEMGLNRPILVQYGSWLVGFLQGDFGTSYSYHMPVAEMIAQKLPITAMLTLFSFLLMILVSIPLGIWTARKEGGVLDRSLTVINQIFMSVPPFLLGVACTYIFGVGLRIFVPGQFFNPALGFTCCHTQITQCLDSFVSPVKFTAELFHFPEHCLYHWKRQI